MHACSGEGSALLCIHLKLHPSATRFILNTCPGPTRLLRASGNGGNGGNGKRKTESEAESETEKLKIGSGRQI